jgi:hypothetical protein
MPESGSLVNRLVQKPVSRLALNSIAAAPKLTHCRMLLLQGLR